MIRTWLRTSQSRVRELPHTIVYLRAYTYVFQHVCTLLAVENCAHDSAFTRSDLRIRILATTIADRL